MCWKISGVVETASTGPGKVAPPIVSKEDRFLQNHRVHHHRHSEQTGKFLDTGQALGMVKKDASAVGDDKTTHETVRHFTNIHVPLPMPATSSNRGELELYIRNRHAAACNATRGGPFKLWNFQRKMS